MKKAKVIEIDAKKCRQEIEEDGKRTLKFGISCLDEMFFGIKPSDLIVITADSSIGKTEIASSIACNIAKSGKKVYFFALESYCREIERRINFKLAAKEYYSDPNRHKGMLVNFALYENNDIDARFKPYAIKGEQECERIYKNNLKIVHRTSEGYNVDDFVADFMDLSVQADVVIVDHIGYFDQPFNMNEYQSLSYAAKKINEVVNIHKVPVICISHVNRQFINSNMIVPDMRHLHGSSNIAKEATKILTIATSDTVSDSKHLHPTYMYHAKGRSLGEAKKYVVELDYDSRSNEYGKYYHICKIDRSKENKTYLHGEEIPSWAKSAIGK
jgi:replicative DNA helicase